MIELVKYDKKYLGNVIIPKGAKLKVEGNKVVFKCSEYLRDRLNTNIYGRIEFLCTNYGNSKKIVEHDSTEEDYEVWNIYVMEEKHIPIKNFADGLAELMKEFPTLDDSSL